MKLDKKDIVVLVDNKIGNSNQAIALARKIGKPFKIVEVEYNRFGKLPNSLLSIWPLHIKKDVLDKLRTKTHPKIIISSGRRTAALAVHLRKLSKGNTKIIQIMRPNINSREFEVIILPQHDTFNELLPNIVRIIGGLNDIRDRSIDASRELKLLYPELKEFIAVIIGGSSKKFSFNEKNAILMLDSIKEISKNHSLPLFVTFSRRTPEIVKKIFNDSLDSYHHIYDPADGGKNPYPGIITAAEYIITTTDSISMCSEAAATGKPIYAFCPDNFKLKKHRFFLQQLIDLGIVKRLENSTYFLEKYDYEPLDEITRVANIIRGKMVDFCQKDY